MIKKSLLLLSLVSLALSGCGGGNSLGNIALSSSLTRDAAMSLSEPNAVIEGVDLSDSLDQEGASTQIAANARKTMTLYGTNLQLGLKVKFNGAACMTHDLVAFDNENEDSGQTEVQVDCPGQAIGTYALKVTDPDTGTEVFSQNIDVVDPATLTNLRQIRLASIRPVYGSALNGRTAAVNPTALRHQALALLSSGGGTVTGTVRGRRPAASSDVTSPALNYGNVVSFPIKGVVVKLIDKSDNSVAGTTATDASGAYTFTGVPANALLQVQVVAQIAETRATGVTTGAQYNFMLRDNTATGATKPLYTLNSDTFTSSGATDTKDITARLGFDAQGNVIGTNEPRESAPFAILDVVYNAVAGIKAADPNVTLSDLNIYWAPENRPGDGDKTTGLIGTSHFADSGNYPGVFILGKADVDTDEFDRGVIGHEFGHYLQFVASYSDNPGGAHGSNEFKDASLAYGEGFGTAIGGLLAQSQYYIDSSGVKQQSGMVQDLTQVPAAGQANGFYAENSVAYLLYKLGTQYSFTPFWKATTALKSGHESATVFNFLAKFIAQSNGAATSNSVLGYATPVNIKTVNPLGILDSSVQADTAINASASSGATDLEVIYSTLALQTTTTSDVQKITSTDGSFCLNKALRGANQDANSNGLGRTRRFTFTSNYTGMMGLKLFNSANLAFPDGTVFVKLRANSTGAKVPVYGWDIGYGQFQVTNGETYSVVVQVQDPRIIPNTGNTCGNSMSLWKAAPLSII